jgi:hypothetical protein
MTELGYIPRSGTKNLATVTAKEICINFLTEKNYGKLEYLKKLHCPLSSVTQIPIVKNFRIFQFKKLLSLNME